MLSPIVSKSFSRLVGVLVRILLVRSRWPFQLVEVRLTTNRVDRQHARAIECLAHAIEYLEDTRPVSWERTPRLTAMEESVSILKACNRGVFFSCSTESQRNAVLAWG